MGLIALHRNLSNVEGHINFTSKIMSQCLKQLADSADVFNISASALVAIFDESPNGRVLIPTQANRKEADDEGPVVLIFGDSDLSDVTLIVRNKEFRVHKMYLAARSPYFKAMFFSKFKEKDADRVPIVTDGDIFKLVMELLYSDSLEDYDFLDCEFWKTMTGIMQTLAFFNFPPQLVESSLGFHYCGKANCTECANKKIFALVYDLANVKKKVASAAPTILACLKTFSQCFPEVLSFAPKDLAELIEFLGTRQKGIRRTIHGYR